MSSGNNFINSPGAYSDKYDSSDGLEQDWTELRLLCLDPHKNELEHMISVDKAAPNQLHSLVIQWLATAAMAAAKAAAGGS